MLRNAIFKLLYLSKDSNNIKIGVRISPIADTTLGVMDKQLFLIFCVFYANQPNLYEIIFLQSLHIKFSFAFKFDS
ncbi:hypothetical protein N824_25620 [Pedobacter sp. V48]|nr:hypothetical protein N824_25620 [Pedobacter sp. V48]